MSVIDCKDVSILYMTGDFKDIGLKEYVTRKLTGNYKVKEFWADRHVTFSLEQGDMLGIIGTNGAGKSTLLKAITGIMEPTEGSVSCKGSIAALLELASGFDGDLTVKENAYLRGAMLGYTRKFMDEKYEAIIDFAELKDYESRPFKQLSSGMKSRLAFSVASMVQPDILILDEVLSVGDGAFRRKSERKMQEIIHSGATTILVSHSLSQVQQLCNKILWLHKGQQIAFGDDVKELCGRYERFLSGDMSALGEEYAESASGQSSSSGLISAEKALIRPLESKPFLKTFAVFVPEETPAAFEDEKAVCRTANYRFLVSDGCGYELPLLDEQSEPAADPVIACSSDDTRVVSASAEDGRCLISSEKAGFADVVVEGEQRRAVYHLVSQFKDVRFLDGREATYYHIPVYWALKRGITSGSTFRPNAHCTRGQMITFLYRYAGSPDVPLQTDNPFEDVYLSEYYYKAVLWAYYRNILSADSVPFFSPSDPCTREDCVSYLWRYAGCPSAGQDCGFEDVSREDPCAEAVSWAAAKGITTGRPDGSFGVGAPCTRGQTITFLWRFDQA
ncbi:MAG: S-layer homology domain-containing protein [Oscillospiraceae bacterium]|nr:S-layer homology domain-containing protein [Oscillospiraceae bacterium]